MVSRCVILLLAAQLLFLQSQAQIRDGGIDPKNLGKGEWIYILGNAVNHLGGVEPAVTNLASLMAFQKNQGMQYLIIKAGDGAVKFPTDSNPQFTIDVVNAGHAAGLKIFGYVRSFGSDIPGEIAIADYAFNLGADGFVIDAEGEWEPLPNRQALATTLCGGIRTNWPNKFLAHSPFAYINVHNAFPYKEFGYYCDAAMPQAYWVEFGETPTASVNRMNTNWNNFHNGLTGIYTNSIKPVVPVGQGWSGSGTVTAAQITEFISALKTTVSPASAGGYKGVNYFRTELHPADVMIAVRTNTFGTPPVGTPVIGNVSAAPSDVLATMTWTTDQSSDSVIEYGLSTSYGSSTTNTSSLYYHTLAISGLTPNTTYHYRAKSKNSANQQSASGDFVVTTTSVPVNDLIIESRKSDGTLTANPPYSDASFSDSTLKSSAAGGLVGLGSRYGFSGTPTFTVRPPLAVSGGTFDVFLTHGNAGSLSADVTVAVAQTGCTGLPATTTIFRQPGGNTWELLGRMICSPGTNVPVLTFSYSAGTLNSTNGRMYSDAIKFVYVPPPPSGPSIATHPQSQSVNQGSAATFTVVASGSGPLNYQWRHAGTNLAGATASAYTKNNAQSVDAGSYVVVVTNSVNAITSSVATLTVNMPPAISSAPQNVTTNQGSSVTFSVSATGTAPLEYRWQFNGSDFPGATSNSITLNTVQPADAGTYSVTVSNVAGTAAAGATLLVIVPPAISTQPQSLTTNIGADATFSVTATGTLPLNYQWRFNGLNISGATDSSYTRTNTQTGDAGNYSAVVTNAAGTATTDDAVLTLLQSNLPHIDNISLLSDGSALLDMSGGPGNFAIDAAPVLSGWTQLVSFTATNALFQYVDSETNQASRFYRLRALR